MTYKQKVVIGDAVLYLGDCMDVLPTLDKVDAVITDPPYGVSMNKNKGRRAKNTDEIIGDEFPPDLSKFLEMKCIFWGGNNFDLPRSTGWLVWFKHHPEESQHSQAELAWTNIDGAVRLKKHKWQGMLQENMSKKEERQHPTQKPVQVMEWSIGQAKNNPQTILDPFMGSGTTGVACANMGRKFTGIEREPKYFDIACERIENAYRQQRLFA